VVAQPEIVRDREARIRRYVADLRSFSNIELVAFRQNRERQYAVLHALQLAIEAALEIGTHICSADALGVPSTYAETFRLLADAKVVGDARGERLQRMAQFRNRIVHLYWDVDLDQVHSVLTNRLSDFDEYLMCIETYLGAGAGNA